MPQNLWFKGFLLILAVIAVCSLAFSLVAIPITRQMTYRMSEQSAIAALDRVDQLVETTYQEINEYHRSALEDKKTGTSAYNRSRGMFYPIAIPGRTTW